MNEPRTIYFPLNLTPLNSRACRCDCRTFEVTQIHADGLKQVFELSGQKAQEKKCDAMEGLTKKGERIIEETEDGSATRDVGIFLLLKK